MRTYVFFLFGIFTTSLVSVSLLYHYLDIEKNPPLGYAAMGISVFLLLLSVFALVLVYVKRIYYRGEIFLHTLHSSLRQSLFLSIFLIGLVVFRMLHILTYETIGLLIAVFCFLELAIGSFWGK